MTIRRRCNIEATNMKIEHIPNMIVIGNASTCTTTSFFIVKKKQKDLCEEEEDRTYSYVVQDDADKEVERNTEEVHYGASRFFRDIL